MPKQGSKKFTASHFGERLKAEREHRSWTQSELVRRLYNKGVPTYVSTIGKLESGARSVQLHELVAFADIFGVSIDALTGHGSNGSDLMWSINKLVSTARKTAREVNAANETFADQLQDVKHYATDDAAANDIIEAAVDIVLRLDSVRLALEGLTKQFPMGG